MTRRFVLYLAAALAASAQTAPRSEYPQPQFQRELWMTLNGPWEFEFDDKNAGLAEGWEAPARKFSRRITVPFAFETKLSGIGDTSFHPWVWYRRAVSLGDAWKGKRVLLHFGAVDYRAMVWVNGKLVGSHEGGGVPFNFDITDVVKGQPFTITVRAEDPPTDRYIPRGKQYWEPKSRGIFYTRTTGIWQPVWLEATGANHLQRVRITPSNDGTVRFDARVANPGDNLEFHATVKSGNRVVARTMGQVSGPRAIAGAAVPEPRLWSPATPALYDVTFELKSGGQTLDTVQSYFGFRNISVEGGRFFLNGRPLYIKMLLDQGYWPDSTITPPTDEAIQYDIRLSKEMGFNGARKHQKIEDPRFLYWADKMGFLVSGEIANAYLYDEAYAAAFTREWMEAVERDYNHPSIVMWVPINESWGVPNLHDPKQANHLRSLYTLTKSLDSTRLVIDNDGWEHTDMTDLFAIHDYARNGDVLFAKYKDLGKPGVGVPDNARAALAPGFKYNGTPVILSEFGGISYVAPGSNVPSESWGYAGVEPNQQAAFARLESLYQALAKIPGIVGICYTQTTDVEQEINGVMTFDRKPKFDPAAVRRLNDMLR